MPTKAIQSWNKERRREQNARAQQRSRARRKALEHALQKENAIVYQRRNPTGCQDKATCPRPQLKFDDFLHCFARPSDLENVAKILDTEHMEIGAIIKYGLISMGYCLDDSLFDQRSALCFACWSSKLEPQIDPRFSISTVLLAGVQVLSQLRGPPTWCFQVPDQAIPRALHGNTHASAFFEIARHLGLSFDKIADDDAVSPFTVTDASGPCPSPERTQSIKPDLQPIAEQLTVSHHPYIDLIPFPTFRARALSALAQRDRTFDESALCFDLMHGGMQCNGSVQGSLHGRGDGAPWDARSWEVTPWFFKKWGALVGDENDLIYQNSVWWWARR
ncbi:hypothetical protein BJY01DRAFT_120115 [Aspergillus pseudoustus]|uniref:BZIP domain-containing protein n=1 Tax=Aspergillus pseudoustus TaxID=1810923 RepID=A0ABR4KFT3_9EURO